MAAAAGRSLSGDPARRAAMIKVQVARKELGLDDATYRAVLMRLTGKDSSALLSLGELGRVLDEFKAKGWKPLTGGPARRARKDPAPADHPAAGKARALWISLGQLGAIDDPSERALEAFARRQLKVEKLQWADQGQCYKLIEALKAMAARHGWDQNLAFVHGPQQVETLKRRLLDAILRKLGLPPTKVRPERLDEAIVEAAVRLRGRR